MIIPFPERLDIDFERSDDPRDVVHLAVECLAKGGIVGLPTETGYLLAASPLRAEACDRLAGLIGGGAVVSCDVLLKDARGWLDWVAAPSILGERLAGKLWPGPAALSFPFVTEAEALGKLVAPARALLDQDRLYFRVPGHEFPRSLLRLSSTPLLAGRPASIPLDRPTTIEDMRALSNLDMLIGAAIPLREARESRIAVNSGGWELEWEGAIPRESVARAAGTLYLFVCTGNTCRSPMAEAIFRARLAGRLGLRQEELERAGHFVASAGVSAFEGQTAARHAIEVVRFSGGSLAAHRSRRATNELVREADHVIAMTGEHFDMLVELAPDRADSFRMLRPDGTDLDDPYGADLATYRRTAEEIDRSVSRLLDDFGIRRAP